MDDSSLPSSGISTPVSVSGSGTATPLRQQQRQPKGNNGKGQGKGGMTAKPVVKKKEVRILMLHGWYSFHCVSFCSAPLSFLGLQDQFLGDIRVVSPTG